MHQGLVVSLLLAGVGVGVASCQGKKNNAVVPVPQEVHAPLIPQNTLPQSGGAPAAVPVPSAPAPVPPSRCTLPVVAQPPADAQVVVVGDGVDPHSCRDANLIEKYQGAVAKQNGDSGAIVVKFSCGPHPVVIQLGAPLVIKKDTFIYGDGLVTLDGRSQNVIVTTLPGKSLVLNKITFTNGHSNTSGHALFFAGGSSPSGSLATLYLAQVAFDSQKSDANDTREGVGGGAVAIGKMARVVVSESTFRNNYSANAGALVVPRGPVEIINSSFEDNGTNAFGDAGAVAVVAVAGDPVLPQKILFCGNRFVNNTADRSGGALWISLQPQDEVLIQRSFFQENKAQGHAKPQDNELDKIGFGGAILAFGGGLVRVEESTFARNASGMGGGGVAFLTPGQITNSTFFENKTMNTNVPQAGFGGGLFTKSPLTLTNVTLVGNEAGRTAGGIYGTSVTAFNSVLARNRVISPAGAAKAHCFVPFLGGSAKNFQFPSDGATAPSCGNSAVIADPLFDAGLSGASAWPPVIVFSSSSSLRGAGQRCPPVDQRGLTRAGRCDVGAWQAEN